MATPTNPFEAMQAMMLENLEKVQGMTQSYMDAFEKAMKGVSPDKDEQITTVKEYVERKVAANKEFVEKILHADNFQEVFRIQVDYFQSFFFFKQKTAYEIGAKMAGSLKAN